MKNEAERAISEGKDNTTFNLKGHRITFILKDGEVETVRIVSDELVGMPLIRYDKNDVGDMIYRVIGEIVEKRFTSTICVGYSYIGTDGVEYLITSENYEKDEYYDTDVDENGNIVEYYTTETYTRFYANGNNGSKILIRDTGMVYGIKHGRGESVLSDFYIRGDRNIMDFSLPHTRVDPDDDLPFGNEAVLRPENIVMNKTE